MDRAIEFKRLLDETDFSDASSIERYAVRLKGMTFRDVLDLGIAPEGVSDKDYSSKNYKGGMGNLLEERYFGYQSNSSEEADFADAGVELKATCYDIHKKDGKPSAGERLVLTMIPFDEEIPLDLDSSHLWNKCQLMLLVFYRRERDIDKYDQKITDVHLFRIPETDLKIIRDDYAAIAKLIREGRADELSEGMTTYLGACTKGATAASSWVKQHYPRIDAETGEKTWTMAKKRAFSLKRSYMDYVLHHYVLGKNSKDDNIVQNGLGNQTFDQYIESVIASHAGKTDRELCSELDMEYTANKSQWTKIVYRLLGVKTSRAEEFIKANISLRCVRMEANGRIKESLSLDTFDFMDLIEQEWETSDLRAYLEQTRFLFVIFHADSNGAYRLERCHFWSMPIVDIDSEAKRCWEETVSVIRHGVEIIPKAQRGGKTAFYNNLPGTRTNKIMHVRPHTKNRAYKLSDGTVIGDIERYANVLPDGRYMTTQSFWINNTWISKILEP